MSGPLDWVQQPDGSIKWKRDVEVTDALNKRDTEVAEALATTRQYVRDYVSQTLVAAGGAPVFVFQQESPATVWVIAHALNGYPTIVVVDSAGQPFIGDVHYDSPAQITITFSAPFSGVAYLR